ncbi:MAG: DUF3298 and DUF4163 domain-containing protein [Desulfovibrio sp.]|nr:DUF3298 and DUF4163 domain-containing protein [Desulfovibrio sp.]
MQFMPRANFLAGMLIMAAWLLTPFHVYGADEVENAINLAREQADSSSQQAPEEPAPKNSEADSPGVEQAVYPGIRNCHIERGGNGEPAISIYYPEIGNDKVDEAVKKYAESVADGYQKETSETWSEDEEKPDSFGNWEESGFFTIERPGPNVISITFNIYTYTGGAHGMVAVVVQNYDLKTGKRLDLADLFEKPEVALEILARISRERLRQSLGDETVEDMLQSGTEPVADNFLALALTPAGVTVEFQPYQVGPWSIGQQRVEISLADLQPAGPRPFVWPAPDSLTN